MKLRNTRSGLSVRALGAGESSRVNNPRKSVAGKEPQDTSLHFKLRLREKDYFNQVTGKKKVSLFRTVD